jgi:flagellar biosynthesis anti-sigma factor FlgM
VSNSIRNIDSILPNVEVEAPSSAGSTAATNTSTSTSGIDRSTADDSADLSPLADLMQTAAVQAGSISSFRSGLVGQLKAAIADGSYNPDPNLVAARIAAVLSPAQ